MRLSAGPDPTKAVELGMVASGGSVYVRSFRGPESLWFRAARDYAEGSIEMDGVRYAVVFAAADPAGEVEAAFRCKYRDAARLLETPDARAATIRIDRAGEAL